MKIINYEEQPLINEKGEKQYVALKPYEITYDNGDKYIAFGFKLTNSKKSQLVLFNTTPIDLDEIKNEN